MVASVPGAGLYTMAVSLVPRLTFAGGDCVSGMRLHNSMVFIYISPYYCTKLNWTVVIVALYNYVQYVGTYILYVCVAYCNYITRALNK